MPSISNSASARRGALQRLRAGSAPVTISLATSESKAPGTVMPASIAGVQAHARAGRARACAVMRAGGGQEAAAGVLGVDPELDGVAARRRVVVAELLAGGDPEHLAHQVDAR